MKKKPDIYLVHKKGDRLPIHLVPAKFGTDSGERWAYCNGEVISSKLNLTHSETSRMLEEDLLNGYEQVSREYWRERAGIV